MEKIDQKTAENMAIFIGSVIVGVALFTVGLVVGLAINLTEFF
jgi:uncharacterized membrane protein